jgi:2',3'-cyclic-nucleotide 2'-phosphodiesterase (5'-nucleotidase family)
MADDTSKSNTAIVIIVVALVALVIGGLVFLCGCLEGGKSAVASKPNQRGERVATILAVNDVYRIDGVGEKEIGGLHRLRTLRKTIEKKTGNVLLLHAGDFLSPSLEGRVFKGEQMIDAMNNLDGDRKKFDRKMFVAFGNHEFDDSDCNKSPAPLKARLDESQFTWLNVNLDFSNCASMKDVTTHRNVKRTAIVELGGIKFGIFGIGLTPDTTDAKKHPRFGDIYQAARDAIKELRAKKVNVVVALTHLDQKDDQLLIDALSGSGLDLVIGGHDHTWMELKDNANVVRGYKADSDAKSAWQIEVRLPPKGGVTFKGERIALDESVVPDRAMNELAKKWSAQAEAKFCALRKQANQEPYGEKCLQARAGTTQFPISLEEANNRNSETKFGRWIAEAVRQAAKADVAIVNAGILGLNTNLPKGSTLRYQHVLDIFRFDGVVAVREVTPRTICEAIRHGFGRPGTGGWPHRSAEGEEDGGGCEEEVGRQAHPPQGSDLRRRNAQAQGRQRSLCDVRRRRLSFPCRRRRRERRRAQREGREMSRRADQESDSGRHVRADERHRGSGHRGRGQDRRHQGSLGAGSRRE